MSEEFFLGEIDTSSLARSPGRVELSRHEEFPDEAEILKHIEMSSREPVRNPLSFAETIKNCRELNLPVPILAIFCPNWSIDDETGQRTIAPINGEKLSQKLGMLLGREIPSLIGFFNDQGLATHLTIAISDVFDQSWVLDAKGARENAIQNLKATKTLLNRFGLTYRPNWNLTNRGRIVLHSEIMGEAGFRLLERRQLEAQIDGTPMSLLFSQFRDFFRKIGEYEVLIPKGDFEEMERQELERLRKNWRKWLNRVCYLSAQYAVDGLLAEKFTWNKSIKDNPPITPIVLNTVASLHGLAIEQGWNFLRKPEGLPPLPIIRLTNNGIEHEWDEPAKEPILFDK